MSMSSWISHKLDKRRSINFLEKMRWSRRLTRFIFKADRMVCFNYRNQSWHPTSVWHATGSAMDIPYRAGAPTFSFRVGSELLQNFRSELEFFKKIQVFRSFFDLDPFTCATLKYTGLLPWNWLNYHNYVSFESTRHPKSRCLHYIYGSYSEKWAPTLLLIDYCTFYLNENHFQCLHGSLFILLLLTVIMAMIWVVSLIYTANKPKYYGEQRRDQKKAEDNLKGTRLPAGKNVRFNFVLLARDSRRGFSHTLDLTQLLFDGNLRKFLSLLWHISIAQKSLRPALVDQDPV